MNTLNIYLGSVLIVDESVQITDLVGQWLKAEELEVFTAESGLNALAKVQMFAPDVVITNAELPDISGFDLCKKIKSDEQMQFTQVLCVSGLDSETARLRASAVGADDYIESTAEHYVFASKVKSLLRVKRLSNQLRQKYAELEEKNHIIDIQLKMGMQVQRALIPDINTQFNDCRILSRYFPAMGVGGDFYVMVPLTQHSYSIIMGDVSGHGIAAAFLTAILNMMIANLAPKYFNPDQLLFYLNNELCSLFEKSSSQLFACIFCAVINTKDKYVRYANAGQALPLYVNSGAAESIELESSGKPVGMMKDSRYSMRSIEYNRNDLLLFMTDGLQDVFYKDQPDEFTSRLKEILTDIRYVDDMREILDIVCNNFYNDAATGAARMAMDDVSMILCRL